MSGIEEPPTKVLKMEVEASSLDSTMESHEGQEEWLSEGVLTDEDYMAANTSQDSSQEVVTEHNIKQEQAPSLELPQKEETSGTFDTSMKVEQNIEDTLNNFERTETSTKDTFDDLLKKEGNSEPEQSDAHSDDDGHNTDDLLRMLGEGDQKKKKKVLTSIREKKARRETRSSEDEYMFEGAKVTTLKLAKNAIIRKQATKAVPEDLSDRDSDMSDEDVSTAKKMFTVKQRPTAAQAQNSRSHSAGRAQNSRSHISNVKTEKPKPTPVKQYSNTKAKSLLKPQDKHKEHPEIINEEEFLEDDDFDLDDDIGDESSMASGAQQPIRRPERMDEEIPSDDDSHSEDDSLYDVMPSSDSEDMDDWFTLDIRAERAGDYLPWLGDKAHKLLTEEKHRVKARLDALRQSVTALQSSGRVQSDQIKVATDALHELDAMLAAA